MLGASLRMQKTIETPKKYPQNFHTPKNIYFSEKSIQTQQKLELKRPKSVLNYKTKRNTKQTPWNMIKHDQTDKIRDCA